MEGSVSLGIILVFLDFISEYKETCIWNHGLGSKGLKNRKNFAISGSIIDFLGRSNYGGNLIVFVFLLISYLYL